MTRTENWTVKPDGKGAFNATFEMFENGKSTGGGAALSGITKEQAEAHCEMARRNNAERDAKHELVKDLFSKTNWKNATGRYVTYDQEKATKIYDALVFFCGGAELAINANGSFTVKSHGYYHYIGA